MTTVYVELSKLGAQYRMLGPRMKTACLRGAMAGALRAVTTLHRATGQAPPANPAGKGTGGAVNTGHYKRSWKAERLPDGARVHNTAPYSGVIEHGRRPGARMPPPKILVGWIQRRLSVSRERAEELSWPFARAIARRGLLPRKVLTNSIPDITKGLMEEVEAELEKELARGGAP